MTTTVIMNNQKSETLARILQDRARDTEGLSKSVKKHRSERTTFNLPEETFDTIDWLSDYWDLSQKEVIDLACEELVKSVGPLDRPEVSPVDHKLNGEPKSAKVRKTVVLSQDSLKRLNLLSQRSDTSRDRWLELGVQIVEVLTKHEIAKHEEMLDDLRSYLGDGERLERALKERLGTSDPVVERFQKVMVVLDNIVRAVMQEVENGVPVDPDGM